MSHIIPGKLDQIIEHTRAVNLVLKLQRDFEILADGKSWRGAATTASELAVACLALKEIELRRETQQLEFAATSRSRESQYLLAV